jgi:hypothetical protein
MSELRASLLMEIGKNDGANTNEGYTAPSPNLGEATEARDQDPSRALSGEATLVRAAVAASGAGDTDSSLRAEVYVPSSSTAKPKTWGKFGLNEELENGLIVLLPGERILESWNFVSTAMNLNEWFATIVTFGFYYLVTRILLKRKRNYKILVTNFGVTIKEEMHENWLFYFRKIMEDQATFPLSTLTYVCCEEMGTKLRGFIPKSVVLEMRFGRYPFISEIPSTEYRTIVAMMFDPFVTAMNFAFKHAFQIDFDKSPIIVVMAIARAMPLMANPFHWLVFGGFFGLSIVIQIGKWVWKLMKTALLDPSVGPRQAIGECNARQFRVIADISEDPTCVEVMRRVVRRIVDQLPDREIVPPEVQSRLRAPLVRVSAADKTRKQLNNKKKYGEVDDYVVLEEQFHLPAEEVVFDVCPFNPKWGMGDYRRIVFSLGAYYFTDLAGHINHRKNMYFTNKRIVSHSVLLDMYGEVEHSRLDFWVVDRFTNVGAVNFRRKQTLYATAFNFGWITFEMNIQNPFMTFIFRSLFRPTFEPAKGTGLTGMTMEEWQTKLGSSATVTAAALKPTENIDCAIKSDQRVFSFCHQLINCFMQRQPKTIVTSTDEGLYMESYSRPPCRPQTRTFLLIPWCDVDGIFWQNFDAAGPDCFQSYLLSCVCPGIFGYSGCCCCCFNPNGAQQNNKFYFDPLFGHKGTTVAVCPRGDRTFRLNFVMPSRFYGVQDSGVNALVDSINLRAMKGDRHRRHIARAPSYLSPGPYTPGLVSYTSPSNMPQPPSPMGSSPINPFANAINNMPQSISSVVNPLAAPLLPAQQHPSAPYYANSPTYQQTGMQGQSSSGKFGVAQPVYQQPQGSPQQYATVISVAPAPGGSPTAPPSPGGQYYAPVLSVAPPPSAPGGPVISPTAAPDLSSPTDTDPSLAKMSSTKSAEVVIATASYPEAVAVNPNAPVAQQQYAAVTAVVPPPHAQYAPATGVTGANMTWQDAQRIQMQSSMINSSNNPGGVITSGQGAVSNAALSMLNGGTSQVFSVTQPIEVPAHYQTTTVAGYRSPNARSFTPTKVGFPMNFSMDSGIATLAPGERLLKSWKVETTQLEWWEILYIILSFGTYLIYQMIFYQTRRFYNIYVTTDRVLIKEEIFSLTGLVIQLIYENQASFKLVDLCYIGAQDSGPRGLFCCLPPTTDLHLRFGRYPLPSDIPKSLSGASPSSSDGNVFLKAYLKAVKKAYGLSLSGAPHYVAEAQMAYEQHPRSLVSSVLQVMHFIPVFLVELASIFMHMMWMFLIHLCYSDEHSSGPEQLLGEMDARSYSFKFKTSDATNLSAEIIQFLTDLIATKIDALKVPDDVRPLQQPRYVHVPSPQIVPTNDTDMYGEDRGFAIIEKMWRLMPEEVVLDVQPYNPKLTFWAYVRVLFDIWAIIYLWIIPQFKKSYMLTNRRLISHNMRAVNGVVRYSNLEMWFLVPTSTYTIVKETERVMCGLCKPRVFYTFIADSNRFGHINLTLKSDKFIKSILRVTNERKFFEPTSEPMTRAAFDAVPVLQDSTFTSDLLSDKEVIDSAVGAILPKTMLSILCCRGTVTSTFTFTNKAIYLEVYTRSKRILLCVPWYCVRGLYWSNFQAEGPCCNSASSTHGIHGYNGAQLRINLRDRDTFSGVALPGRYYGGENDDNYITATVDKLFRRFKKVTAKITYDPEQAPWL